MPKLETFEITVRTGERGREDIPQWAINGFTVALENVTGNARKGQTLTATAEPGSFPHSLVIVGPEEGVWDIEEVEVTFHPEGEPAYTVRFGAVTLDSDSDLNIWHERPQPVFDV